MKNLFMVNEQPYGGEISVCGSCLGARGITEEMLSEGAKRGTMVILTEWTAWADKVLVF